MPWRVMPWRVMPWRRGPASEASEGLPQRQADALVLLAESALDSDLVRGSRADRYQVVVHVDAEALGTPST